MPTRTGYGAPQLPHRPQHKPRPEQNQSLTPNRPHAAEPTRKALVTRESTISLKHPHTIYNVAQVASVSFEPVGSEELEEQFEKGPIGFAQP